MAPGKSGLFDVVFDFAGMSIKGGVLDLSRVAWRIPASATENDIPPASKAYRKPDCVVCR